VIPKPWSYSALEDFVNCPRAYHAKKVIKSVVEVESAEMGYGNYVHKHFENRQRQNTPLPADLAHFEPLMQRLAALPGISAAEEKVALNRRGVPCGFFAKDVWWRGILDFHVRSPTEALIVDYKTGKSHRKFGQLKLFALYLFAKHEELQTVRAHYYWTKTQTMTGATYTRDMSSALWMEFVPDLKQFVEAFQSDIWQPRPSGLCRGWCPVKDCEFWTPKPMDR